MAGHNQRNNSEAMKRILNPDLDLDRPGPGPGPGPGPAAEVPVGQLVNLGGEDEGTKSKEEGSKSKDEGTKSKEEGTKSKDEGTKSKDEGTKSKDEGTKSKDKGMERETQGNWQVAKTKSWDEGTMSKNGGTKSKEEGTKSKEEGTKSKDEGTKSKDEGTKSKNGGTKSKDEGLERETQGNWQVAKMRSRDKETRPKDQGARSKDEEMDWISEDEEMKSKDEWTKYKDENNWQVARMRSKDEETRSKDQETRSKDETEDMDWTNEDLASSCCRLDELKRLDQTELGRLDFSRTDTVLIDVQVFNAGAGLMPQVGRDMWAPNFVKMPNSPACRIQKKGESRVRWEVIAKRLAALAKKSSASVDNLEEVIMKFNPKYKGQWTFDALSSFVKVIPKEENDFAKLVPKIAALALSLPEHVQKAIPLLRHGHQASITLSQVQISCLLANAFFCTFPHRNKTSPNAEFSNYPTINFSSLFWSWSTRKKEKLRAIMHYFRVMTDDAKKPKGLVTFERRCLKDSELPHWRSCTETMTKLSVTSRGSIETEGSGMLQVDFASSRLGGGVLGSGLVQEEILFLMNPELIVSRLFTEKLGDKECLIITGSQRFSRYSGFGDSFQWAGPHVDDISRDGWDRLKRQIVAIDALNFRHPREQYSMAKVTRELNKAYCGFKGKSGVIEPDIATGKWGCGAFNGDAQLKAVIQLMAAAKARRGLAFFTFQDEKLQRGLEATHRLLVATATTVGSLYSVLENYCSIQQASGSHVDLFHFLKTELSGPRL